MAHPGTVESHHDFTSDPTVALAANSTLAVEPPRDAEHLMVVSLSLPAVYQSSI